MARPTWIVRLGDVRLPVWVTPRRADATWPTLLLAPGAGTEASHPWLTAQARALGDRGIRVVRFDFAYRALGRTAPDRLPKLMAAYQAVIERVQRAGTRPGRLWLGGKSMGGRVASHVAAEGCACAGLIFYGYPLAPRGQFTPDRIAHWPRITAPALFLTGTRDRLCPLPALAAALPRWPGTTTEFRLPDGDHSFTVPKRSGRTDAEVHRALADAVADWVTNAP